jgi:hypothetical protein
MKNNYVIPATIIQGDNEVQINFKAGMPEDKIRQQVSACETHTCDCCTPEFREQVDDFEVLKEGENISVHIKGSISAEHVKENMLSCAPNLSK